MFVLHCHDGKQSLSHYHTVKEEAFYPRNLIKPDDKNNLFALGDITESLL